MWAVALCRFQFHNSFKRLKKDERGAAKKKSMKKEVGKKMDRAADQKGEGPQSATHFYGLQNKSNGICFCNETGGHL